MYRISEELASKSHWNRGRAGSIKPRQPRQPPPPPAPKPQPPDPYISSAKFESRISESDRVIADLGTMHPASLKLYPQVDVRNGISGRTKAMRVGGR
ncbi:uncharacterized protein BP5553_04228 [Venustampulla echinocandica]|uniref:Uncharacterized protein n=1 Tax=Venustampulla echinocandica TaxID=2656787 RepID=A0A370TWN9_9HELO|nr:uncharacterized protein BP5553_04228 [Venustampulla echinocandica]RDL39888.1 hypothetical protein BP5553_04228 [Venustampulla echinocandica]